MTLSGLQDLKEDEGLRLMPYRCSEGYLTIGYGWNLDKVPIPGEVADLLLSIAVARAENDARTLIDFDRLTLPRQDVVVNMRYQLGAGGFRGFRRFIAAVNHGEYRMAAAEMLDSRWAQQTPTRAARLARIMENGQ